MYGPVEYIYKDGRIGSRRIQCQLPAGMIKKVIQSCPEQVEGKAANSLLGPAGRNCLAYPEGEHLCVDARSVLLVREHGKVVTGLLVLPLARLSQI